MADNSTCKLTYLIDIYPLEISCFTSSFLHICASDRSHFAFGRSLDVWRMDWRSTNWLCGIRGIRDESTFMSSFMWISRRRCTWELIRIASHHHGRNSNITATVSVRLQACVLFLHLHIQRLKFIFAEELSFFFFLLFTAYDVACLTKKMKARHGALCASF
jgi:hypothetical protein